MKLRWRIGIFLGNAQASNDCFVGAVNGDVVKSRSIVRVTASSRWTKETVLNIRGTPHCFRPSGDDDPAARVEEQMDPHENADKDDGRDTATDQEPTKEDVAKIDIRITMNDLRQFGFTEGCPKCKELEAGNLKTFKAHNDECRLRM